MKDSSKRNLHYSLYGAPTPDDPGYESALKQAEKNLANNSKLRKKIKDSSKIAYSIAYTQACNGLQFLQDKEIRYFQQEYNSRLWNHGLASMPSSFRVLEGFYEWISNLFMFKIFDEEEHLFSFFDFIDFVTSDCCSNSIDYFIKNVEDNIILSYNILNEVEEITFRTKDSIEYVIGGVSIIKRGNEAYLLLVAGEKTDTANISKERDFKEADYSKSYISPDKSLKREAVKLFGKSDTWKVNLYLRIDLSTKTADLRYIQKDMGDSLETITDDFGMLKASLKDEDFFEYMKSCVDQIENYEAIFEVAYKCLHLPEFFDVYEDSIIHEEHPTQLFGKTLKKSIISSEIQYSHKYFFKTRDVWVLDLINNLNANDFILRQSELKIQKDGYWDQLAPGQIGRGKNGEPIHNRTWVEKTLTWYETVRSKDVIISTSEHISQNSGYIYIMRNPAHALDLFKIGLTTKTVEQRAGQLSATTGSPDKFLIIHRWKANDCIVAEKLIHDRLREYRINPKREFFNIDLEKILPIISSIIEEVNQSKS
ncbi:GIY-YIG nuclease family protein [Pedobacter hartonius]|uniref:T5orf172 domain-containing protein n=1 Tax=Pedobacter hartonius TaxID=425514 RepID=A0A1H4HKA4_9SPHI|nr:GIY-YIG nuclease family protein [Pedobacter hartonius]SEB22213.1 T5orf172 domain-containing protein [Pedobacter hartonius]